MQLGDVTEISGFLIRPESLTCEEVPARAAGPVSYKPSHVGAHRECGLTVKVVNNTKEASGLDVYDGAAFVLYVAENRFPSKSGNETSELFPNESATIKVVFEIPTGSTATSLAVEEGRSNYVFFGTKARYRI